MKVETKGLEGELNKGERVDKYFKGPSFSWWMGREIIREEGAATFENALSVVERQMNRA